mmetsp:Transcript_117754/g.311111  ORF Transcript_117754/g.311111 Transcript_117754/m.311111 type:complete len:313 (+) Transcript_117754:290-1228(+)
MVRLAFHHTGRDDADPNTRHQLDGDARGSVRVLQIHDQLRDVLDGVHVVVRRRGDQANAWGRLAGLRDLADDLVAGQLAALARLGALRELDLYLVRVGQVLRRNAEAARGHLLDLRAHGVRLEQVPLRRAHLQLALLHGLEALWVLASLTGVALAARPVHRDGHGPVGLVRDGPERGGPRAEALNDVGRGLDLVQGDRLALVGLELEAAADLRLLGHLVLPAGEELVPVHGIGPGGLLELVDDVWRVRVHLTRVNRPEMVLALVWKLLHLVVHQRRQVATDWVGELVELQGILHDRVEAHPVKHPLAAVKAL